jgi:hypothetical protein
VDAREVQALYVLHQAGACLGEPVRVSEEPNGTRVIRVGAGGDGYSSEASLEFVLKALSEMRRKAPTAQDPAAPLAVALQHAWALRSIAGDFATSGTPEPSEPSSQLLASMLDDHAGAIRRELSAAGLARSGAYDRKSGAADWRECASLLFDDLARLNELRNRGAATKSNDLSIATIYACVERIEAALSRR